MPKEKQSAIEWLEAAGVDCSLLRKKFESIAKLTAAKDVVVEGEKRHHDAVAPVGLDAMVRNFVISKPVEDALVREVVEEFLATRSA